MVSLSLRERGLKCPRSSPDAAAKSSLSLRERGLKSIDVLRIKYKQLVALLARAWIEITYDDAYGGDSTVALLARAWIEIPLIPIYYAFYVRRSPCESVD